MLCIHRWRLCRSSQFATILVGVLRFVDADGFSDCACLLNILKQDTVIVLMVFMAEWQF